MTTKKPVHEIREGRIKAALWLNEGQGGSVFHTVTLGRLYKAADGGNWKTLRSFARGDLPRVREVLDQVETWMHEHDAPAAA